MPSATDKDKRTGSYVGKISVIAPKASKRSRRSTQRSPVGVLRHVREDWCIVCTTSVFASGIGESQRGCRCWCEVGWMVERARGEGGMPLML